MSCFQELFTFLSLPSVLEFPDKDIFYNKAAGGGPAGPAFARIFAIYTLREYKIHIFTQCEFSQL